MEKRPRERGRWAAKINEKIVREISMGNGGKRTTISGLHSGQVVSKKKLMRPDAKKN